MSLVAELSESRAFHSAAECVDLGRYVHSPSDESLHRVGCYERKEREIMLKREKAFFYFQKCFV